MRCGASAVISRARANVRPSRRCWPPCSTNCRWPRTRPPCCSVAPDERPPAPVSGTWAQADRGTTKRSSLLCSCPMSSFLAAPSLPPDSAFDTHFGFSPGIEPDFPRVAPDEGAGAGDPAPILASACADLSAGARALGAAREAALFADLPTRTGDLEDPASESGRKAFLHGEGAGLLRALARLAVEPGIPVPLRREQLELAAEAT